MLQVVGERNHFLTRGWLHAFIGRHLDQLQIYHSLPQEDTGMIVPRAHLEEHIRIARSLIAGIFSELVFNLDEVGSSDWEDRKPKKVIVPRSVSPDDVYHPVRPRYRHMTLLACVSAAGDALTPCIFSPSPIPASSWVHRLREHEDAMIWVREPAHIDENILTEPIPHVFIP
jgi:hypothetical protein